MDVACAPPEAVRNWLPVHERRAERSAAARAEAQQCELHTAALDAQWDREAAEERDLQAARVALQTELEAADADAMYEADLRDILLAEVAERESFSSEMHRRLLDAEVLRGDAAADVANLQADVAKLRNELLWAQRYREGADAQRARLESEVLEAERRFDERQRDQRAAGAAARLAGCDLWREARSEEASEAQEAAADCKWREAVQELQQRRANLQIQLMREEHRRDAAATELNQHRSGRGRQTDFAEHAMLV